jgi:MIP family channel proteins
MVRALRAHWPEYLIEAAGLGLFMLVAGLVATLLEYPGSPVHRAIEDPLLRRVPMGLAMGLTAIAIVYSPWGKQSGAHINPAVTLCFYRLGRIEPWDAVFYVLFQVAGGAIGVLLALGLLGAAFSAPRVRYVATLPGPGGAATAFGAEALLSFTLMSVVLFSTNAARLHRYTGFFAGCLVAGFVVIAAPVSGMSINPARSFASALPGGLWTSFWIYVTAPLLGMLVAAQAYVWVRGPGRVACAKLHHENDRRCIFRCGYRRRAAALLLLFVGAAWPRADAVAEAAAVSVPSVGMTVSDADRVADFYTSVLDFEKTGDFELWGEEIETLTGVFGARIRVVPMRLGHEALALTEFVAPRGLAVPADSRSNDLWFQHVAIVVSDIDAAYARLRAHGVEHVSTAVQTIPEWNPAAGGIRAFYFRDPDGHNLELIWFPPGRGDPRWQRETDALFLGIDHTAVAASDTERSLGLYRDLLGLAVAGESENHGPEQERLNQVFGARLRITGLRGREGPGVELLEYLSPAGGRPVPRDVAANDLVHWETTLRVRDLDALAARLRERGAWLVSPRIANVPEKEFGFRRALLVRDPDGHALRLVEGGRGGTR